ncbi:hypothetical protein, partial [Streptomyces sp. bgisy034]|uniref:hypothetical protein n=1 Tax=Streptomyces sp. bgisy034 TaxID=3413774 RepID=UPI003EBA0CC2
MVCLDRRRGVLPSAARGVLAALIRAGVVDCVVSLNWDTGVLESVCRCRCRCRCRYGAVIPAGFLFKRHGDAARPEQLSMLA